MNFHTVKAGMLTVSRQQDLYTLNFPARIAEPAQAPAGLIEALGGPAPAEVFRARDYMVVYENESDVLALKPDFAALSKVDGIGVIVTAKGDSCDFVSRFFAPGAGIPEDPVTGSAHCNLIPYWADRLKKNELHAFQVSSRRGELWCKYEGDRVLMSGKAVTYLKGEIYI